VGKLPVTEENADSEPLSKGKPKSTILVGAKNVMSYVLACVTLFNKGATEVTIKARGRLISRAVDVAEITRHRFMTDLKIASITIGTATVQTEKGSDLNVSTIDITLAR
jgi:DNA-binding protein